MSRCAWFSKLTMSLPLSILAALAFAPAHAADALPQVQFAHCTEFVGIAPADLAGARALVPLRYTLMTTDAGAELIVRVTDCESVRVGALPARAGRLAQIGLLIVSPDGTGTDPLTAINNYTLSYATNVPALALALRSTGVPAVVDANLAYEFAPPSGTSALYAAVAPPAASSPTWFLDGSVNTPTIASTFLANWWSFDGTRQVKMASTFPTIAFDFASVVSFTTSHLNFVGQLLSGNRIASFPVSYRGAYDAATMVVTTGP